MLHVVLQAVLLWDVHVAAAVERWRRDAGRHVRGWFAALGETEALAALATLAHDNPAWVLPTVTDDAAVLEAAALGHPLLAEAARVANDVRVGPPGTVLLVTGSNMSGKSTLLRAIGLNAVLAQAGGPVCATRLSTPRLAVMTSVVVHDALAEETSLFLAELRRVKRIVDAARAATATPGAPTVLYLLDEVLHGTNSAERRVATRAVLSHLLAARAGRGEHARPRAGGRRAARRRRSARALHRARGRRARRWAAHDVRLPPAARARDVDERAGAAAAPGAGCTSARRRPRRPLIAPFLTLTLDTDTR
jgi:energy-coupling factor transporter ATP-binding protein EcfA2